MKTIIGITLFAAILYGAVKLGKYIGKATTPDDWDGPKNNDEDQSKNMFV